MERHTHRLACAVAAVTAVALATSVEACQMHALLGLKEPVGIWPSLSITPDSSTSANTISATNASTITVAPLTASDIAVPPIDAYVNAWLLNTTGAKGKSPDPTINAAVSVIPANIQQVRYTSTNVYVKATSIPDYNIGGFNGNPNIPANANATFDIPRNPTPAPANAHTATGLGAIGVLVNGVEVFNMSDARSYNNLNVWHNNAGYVEAPSFDAAKGHPQQQGVYHNHMVPLSLESELGANSTAPKLLGYAIDGYPILSAYASLTAGAPTVKMTSGYQLKSYAGGVRGNGGPNVSAQYPLGYFEEDYQWTAGAGNLDQYNGALVYTPQFPSGTYAYFATTDQTGANPAYPYLLGPQYYGTPNPDNLPGGTITVPADSILYTVPEPALGIAISASATLWIRRRRN
jgi:hypothetical protein